MRRTFGVASSCGLSFVAVLDEVHSEGVLVWVWPCAASCGISCRRAAPREP